MSRIRWYGPTLVLLVTVMAVMIAGPRVTQRLAYVHAAEDIRLVRDSLVNSQALADLSQAFRQVARVVEPSVVHIQVSTRRAPEGNRRMEDPRRWFFGPNLPPQFQEPESPDSEQFDRYNAPRPYGSGSGWVYDAQGHIVTNNHVIEGADEIEVRFADGSRRSAVVVGTDPSTDVAVLKVEGGNLHPAALAAEPVEQGDIVFAFGSPFHRFEFSVSQGIVSAKGRELNILHRTDPRGNTYLGYERFIQTDAAINPGNSGGPLTNIRGEIVGMNTAIATQTGTYSGLGFAIPVDMVRDVVQDLLEEGRVIRGYLGVYIEELDPRMARTFGFEGTGVLVRSPIEGSPAEQAGLRRGDIIAQVDDQAIENTEQLRFMIADFRPGAEVTLKVFRDGQLIDLPVVVGELPDASGAVSDGQARADVEDQQALVLRKLGLEQVRTVTPQMAENAPQLAVGVLVEQVRRNSVAASVQLMRGSIINDVMGTPVTSVEELITELNRYDLTQGVRLSVLDFDPRTRSLTPRFVLLELAGE